MKHLFEVVLTTGEVLNIESNNSYYRGDKVTTFYCGNACIWEIANKMIVYIKTTDRSNNNE